MKKLIISFTVITSVFFFGQAAIAQETATDESDSIRNRVREKLEEAVNKPKAFIGITTDKTDSGVQIESIKGEILQISVNDEETTYANVNSTTTESDFGDLAIGDFIVAMGFRNENEVLEAKRILLTDPLTDPRREIIYGNVKEINNRELVVTTPDDTDLVATFPRRWKGPDIDKFSEGENVVMVTTKDNGELNIRTIEKTSTSQSAEL